MARHSLWQRTCAVKLIGSTRNKPSHDLLDYPIDDLMRDVVKTGLFIP